MLTHRQSEGQGLVDILAEDTLEEVPGIARRNHPVGRLAVAPEQSKVITKMIVRGRECPLYALCVLGGSNHLADPGEAL